MAIEASNSVPTKDVPNLDILVNVFKRNRDQMKKGFKHHLGGGMTDGKANLALEIVVAGE